MSRQDPAITQEYERIADEYSAPVQIAGLPVEVINPSAYSTPDEFRRSLVRQLQRTLPAFAPGSVRADVTRAPAAEFARTEKLVRAAVVEAAHQSPVLREVITRDRVGREQTEFFGQKRSWMAQYSAPAMLTKSIGGVPVKLQVIM